MNIDYKFWYIRRDDNGFISEAAIRFYEGEITTRAERRDDSIIPITRYRRSRRLGESDLLDIGGRFVNESNEMQAKIYTTQDFGMIKTDQELCNFLNKELIKVKGREPIDEQKIK